MLARLPASKQKANRKTNLQLKTASNSGLSARSRVICVKFPGKGRPCPLQLPTYVLENLGWFEAHQRWPDIPADSVVQVTWPAVIVSSPATGCPPTTHVMVKFVVVRRLSEAVRYACRQCHTGNLARCDFEIKFPCNGGPRPLPPRCSL